MMQKADPMTIRITNRRLILRHLYHGHANTRSDLSKFTGLTRPAISDVVSSLIDDGFIAEVGYRSGMPGKPPMLLEIPNDARLLVGIQIEVGVIRGVICDLRGTIIQNDKVMLDSTDFESVMTELLPLTHKLAGQYPTKNLGIGISSPGIIDAKNGVINYSANLRWRNAPLLEHIKNEFDLPVYIANDTTCAGLSETLFGSGKGNQRVCTVVIEAGVGAGIVISDENYLDVTNGSAEIGHLKIFIDPDHRLSEKRECLIEEIIGNEGLNLRIKQIAEDTQDQDFLAMSKGGFNSEIIAGLAINGNLHAQEFIQRSGYVLGKGIATLVNLLHPHIIIINGPICGLGEELFNKIWEIVNEDALEEYRKNLEILPSSLDHSVVLGAGALLLRYEMGLI